METNNTRTLEEGVGRAVAGTLLGLAVFLVGFLGLSVLIAVGIVVLTLVPFLGSAVMGSLQNASHFGVEGVLLFIWVPFAMTRQATSWGIASAKALSRRIDPGALSNLYVVCVILGTVAVHFSGWGTGSLFLDILSGIVMIAGIIAGLWHYEEEMQTRQRIVSQEITPPANVAAAQQTPASTGRTHCSSCTYLLGEGARFCGNCCASEEPNPESPVQPVVLEKEASKNVLSTMR